MFEMYGGPWSASVSDKTPARLLWQGRKTGAVLKLAAIRSKPCSFVPTDLRATERTQLRR